MEIDGTGMVKIITNPRNYFLFCESKPTEATMSKELEKEEINITCPHCVKEISFAWVCKIESSAGIRYIYICTNCQKNLAVTHEKGLHSEKLQHSYI